MSDACIPARMTASPPAGYIRTNIETDDIVIF
jgi:hypothetical protein